MMSEAQRRATDFNWLKVLARLEPGATVDQANAEAQVLFQSFVESQAARAADKERPGILRQRAGAFRAPDGFNVLSDNISQPLLILMGIVGLILLLACVNLSGLLLARAEARQREISIRLAIGAGRGRLVRQFLTESLVLAAIGASIGLVLADWFSARLFALFVNGRDLQLSVSPDWRVLAFTTMVAIMACCIAGLAPALRAVRVNVNPTLKEVRARGHRRFGRALVVVQLAISMMLVVGATLFVGTLMALRSVDRGFDASSVLVVSVRTARPYPEARRAIVQQALIERLAALPGVQSASTAQMLPLGGGLWDRRVQVEGYVFRPDEPEQVGFNVIASRLLRNDWHAARGRPRIRRARDRHLAEGRHRQRELRATLLREPGRDRTPRDIRRRDLRDRRRRARREVPGPSLGRDENAVHPLDAAGLAISRRGTATSRGMPQAIRSVWRPPSNGWSARSIPRCI